VNGTFSCDSDEQCQGGTCETTRFCSFPDTTCPSGSRYDQYAGGGLSSQCVNDTVDAGVDGATSTVLHLASGDSVAGSAALALSGTIAIDTGTLMITGATLPAGDTLDARPQLGGGPELAVLHVGSLMIASGAQVRIIGTRPLVIVADGPVDVERVALVEMVEGLHRRLFGGDQVDLGTGLAERPGGLGQLHLLDAFGEQKGHLLSCQFVCHARSSPYSQVQVGATPGGPWKTA